MKGLFLSAALALAPLAALAQSGETTGEVRRVNQADGKVTLRHGPIEGPLDMGAMTMVFQVKDRGLLERLKPGDSGRFKVAKEDGVFWILEMAPATAGR